MGLNEKRMIKRLKEEVIPQHEADLLAITGSAIVYDIEWERFLDNMLALEGLEQWAFATISNTFRLICHDDLGKEEVANQIKRIQLTLWSSSWPAGNLDIAGSLSIFWDWGGTERFSAEMLEERVNSLL